MKHSKKFDKVFNRTQISNALFYLFSKEMLNNTGSWVLGAWYWEAASYLPAFGLVKNA